MLGFILQPNLPEKICLMNYKTDRDAKRQQGLSRMTKKSRQLGLYTKAANTPEDPQGI
jgi:hypothetical protein